MMTSDTSFGVDLGAPQRLGDRDLAELMRRHASEPAVEGADRGARGAGNDDVGHRSLLMLGWLSCIPS